MTTERTLRLPLAVRAGTPAINVKDGTVWARDPRTQDAIGALPQGLIDGLYDTIRESFWDIATEIALRDEFDYTIAREGRSGGWLCIDVAEWLEWLDCDDPLGVNITPDDDEPDNKIAAALAERSKFFRFADEISALFFACEDDFAKRINLLSRAVDVVMHLGSDGGLVIGTPEVYVVAPAGGYEPAVFAVQTEAQAYADTFDDDAVALVNEMMVCDSDLSAKMIAEREDDSDHSREDVIDAIRDVYEERIMDGLKRLGDSANTWNLFAGDPYVDTSGDEYAWRLHLWPTADRKDEDMVAVTITLAEDEGEEDPLVSFGLSVIGHGGEVIAFYQPFNVTPLCWVDGRDKEAVEMRWADFNANISPAQVLQWVSDRGGKAEGKCYCGKPNSVCVAENGAHCHHPDAAAHNWGD